MDELTGHFWISEKELNARLLIPDTRHTFAQLTNGDIVEYSEMTREKKPDGKWDDYKYLGYGKWHHMER